MIEVNLTAALVISIVSSLLSVAFTWFPKLNTWYAAKEKDAKSSLMLGLIVTTTVIIIGLGCFNIINVSGLTCNSQGLTNIAINIIVGLVGGMQSNQGVYGLTKNLAPQSVKALKSPVG
jgi:hypothetical protein